MKGSLVNRPATATDAALLDAAATDPTAFGEFFERHFDSVVGFLYKRTACAESAADLAAETFAAAYLARQRFNPEKGEAISWLLGIARHKLSDSVRKNKLETAARRRLGMEPPELDGDSYEHIESLVDKELLKAPLREAIDAVSPALAKAVYLRVALELPYIEVARRLNCSEGAARLRVMRGLTQLSDAMGARP